MATTLDGIQERLAKYKDENDITYVELGEKIGVSKAVAWDICNNRRKFLELSVVDKILKLLGE